MGARAVFLADPTVGGRYSALSAFGLVPSALAGADVGALLDEAEELAEHLAEAGNPALELGAALGAAPRAGRDKLALADGGVRHHGLRRLGRAADRGVHRQGGPRHPARRPRVGRRPRRAGPDDACWPSSARRARPPGRRSASTGPLGAQFLGWEYATAVAGRVLGINPFDQPNVTESKENTQRDPRRGPPRRAAAATIGAIEVRGSGGVLDGVDLSSHDGVSLAAGRAARRRSRRAATSRSWPTWTGEPDAERRRRCAPRWPAAPTTRSPSGGARASCTPPASTTRAARRSASFLQITGAVDEDLPVPDQPYTLRHACRRPRPPATARRSPTATGPLLHLHLTDRAAGLGQLLTLLA